MIPSEYRRVVQETSLPRLRTPSPSETDHPATWRAPSEELAGMLAASRQPRELVIHSSLTSGAGCR